MEPTQKTKLISLYDLKLQIADSSQDELAYIFARYCGPHNLILRSKVFQYDAAKQITDLVGKEMAAREIDNILTDSLVSDSE